MSPAVLRLAVVCLLVALGGCTQASLDPESGQKRRLAGGTVVFAMGWEPLGFFPLRALDSASYYGQSLVYEGLIKYDPKLNIVPALAESFSVSADGLAYRFRLRPGLRFSDGTPVTVRDIVDSINLSAAAASPYHADYEDIAEVTVVGERELALRLSQPCAPLLSRLIELRILPSRIISLPGNGREAMSRRPIGTGPFRLVSWETATELVFEPNPYYWGRLPSLKRLVWRIVSDPNLLGLALKQGAVDVGQVDARIWSSLLAPESPGRLELARFPGSRTVYFGFNVRRKPFDNPALRNALCPAINCDAIVEQLYGGYASRASSDFSTTGWAYNPHVGYCRFDVDAARKALTAAGYRWQSGRWISGDAEPLAFPILTVRDFQDVAEVVAEDLKRVGIMTEVQLVEFATLRQRYLKAGEFQSVVWSRSVGPDPECILSWHSKGPLNFSGFASPLLDRMLAEGRLATSRRDRLKPYYEIQRILADEHPWIFLVHPDLLVAHKQAVRNVQTSGQDRSGLPWDNPLFNAARWEVAADR